MLAMPTSAATTQPLGRKKQQSKSEGSSLLNSFVHKSGSFETDLDLSLFSSLPVSSKSLFVTSFDTSFVHENNQMFPAPFFIAPLQAMMPPDYNPSAYDGNNAAPFPTPEMFAMYPNMQLIMPMPAPLPQAVMGPDGSPENSSGTTSAQDTAASTPFEAPQFGPGPPIVTGEKLKGPRGCNLFVFHLPNEITNWDLYLLFRRYGTIISVHIMVNKTTGLSKGYGFVSFAYRDDAKAAIEGMDGFRLGKKRLKVQLKRLQDDSNDDSWDDEGVINDTGNTSRVQSYSSRCSSNSNTLPSTPKEDVDIPEDLVDTQKVTSPAMSPEARKN